VFGEQLVADEANRLRSSENGVEIEQRTPNSFERPPRCRARWRAARYEHRHYADLRSRAAFTPPAWPLLHNPVLHEALWQTTQPGARASAERKETLSFMGLWQDLCRENLSLRSPGSSNCQMWRPMPLITRRHCCVIGFQKKKPLRGEGLPDLYQVLTDSYGSSSAGTGP